MGCPCEDATEWMIVTEDDRSHETCAEHIHRTLTEIYNEYGDGAPVFVWKVED